MKKLKIGISCYPSVGGSGVVATNLGNELAKLGHQVHFISYEPPFRLNLRQKNIFFHQVPVQKYDLFRYPDYTLPLAVKIAQIHKKFRLDVLHVHYAIPHATAAILARDMLEMQKLKPLRIVTTLHGTDITLVGKDPDITPVVRYSIERSLGVTAVSKYLKRQTKKIIKTSKSIEVIYNFYTPTPKLSPKAVRRELGVKDKDILAIHSSNLRPIKRIPDLLKIVARLKRYENFKLLILAGDNFAPFGPLVKKLGIQKKIIVKDKVLDIDTYLAAADIGIYPSQDETFGMGILESMSHGHAVVASRAGGIVEVIQDNKSGLLCKVGAVDKFSQAVKLLITDEKLRLKIGAAAKKRAQQKFCAEKIVRQYLNYYYKILKLSKNL